MADKLLTTAEVGDWLRMRPDAVRRQRKAGAFGPTYKVGGKVLIPTSGVQKYLNEREDEPTPAIEARGIEPAASFAEHYARRGKQPA